MISVLGRTEDDITIPCHTDLRYLSQKKEIHQYLRRILSGAAVPNVIVSGAPVEQESPADAGKPARRESLPPIGREKSCRQVNDLFEIMQQPIWRVKLTHFARKKLFSLTHYLFDTHGG